MNNKADIKALFMAHYDRMYLLARIILHDDEESRDVVSDVFARIADGDMKVRRDTAEIYLLTSVRYQCLKVIRARQVRQRAVKYLQLHDTLEMEPFDIQQDRLAEVLDFSEREFTPQTLRVFQLRFQQNKSYAEIAALLNISEAAVYKHLAQSLRKIKNHFNP
ncbi:MAG: sigma-70 family RNA polymerase sigma factor [Prevotella sp.]|nr:sigma-70 family RNA polymerase sigma factor [Prevotella sp.]